MFFKRHLIDAIGSCEETKVWIDFSKDCKYISNTNYERFIQSYKELGKMLNGLLQKWHTF